jgi:TP901 family phage tail tape measure protein
VADTSASDMSELATAMSKSASVANNMGVTIDQLAAQIATITQVTRQAPETTGNALKTIYARINDIKAGTDDAEVSLGNYTGEMAKLGINVLDANGELRDTGDVMTEIGEKWGSMTREQ